MQSDGAQRFEIGAARAGEADGLGVHDLLAAEAETGEKEPDRRMEPEQGADGLFEEREEPVAAAHVEQLMADDGALRRGWQRVKPRREQDGRVPPTEGHRTGDAVRNEEAGADVHLLLHGGDGRRQVRRDRGAPRRSGARSTRGAARRGGRGRRQPE